MGSGHLPLPETASADCQLRGSLAEHAQERSLYSDAMSVLFSHRSTVPTISSGHESIDPVRASCLLGKILRQPSELCNPEGNQGTSTRFEMESYWDWRRFEFVADQTLSILLHVHPDVKSVQARFRSVATPDLRYTAAKQILAAHGVDLEERKLSPFQIR